MSETPISALLGVTVFGMPDGRAAVHLDASATEVERQRFDRARTFLARAGREGLPTTAEAMPARDDRCGAGFAIEERVVGTSMDIATLEWSAARRVRFFEGVCRAIRRMHQEGQSQGTLTPAHVLISGELEPLVLGPDVSFARFAPYAGPESRDGGQPSPAADVFSLGRYLEFLLTGAPPDDAQPDPPALAHLRDQPEGLVRIIRACCRRSPRERYRDVDALLADVAHWREPTRVGLVDGLSAEALAAAARAKESTDAVEPQLPVGFAVRVGLVIGGSAIALLATWLAYGGAADGSSWLAGAGVGAAVAGAVPPMSRLQRAARLAFFACTLLMFAQLDPLHAARVLGARERLLAPSADVRAHAARALVREGERQLPRAHLRHAPLARADLADTDLSGADLRFASLESADLSGAALDGARLEGAHLEGADLLGAVVDDGLVEARCDEATLLPEPYACVEGHARAVDPVEDGELEVVAEVVD